MEYKAGKIAYLEGLRGTAALLVVLHHFCLAFYPAYFFGGDPTMSHLGTLELSYFRSPLSFITNGEFMVSIFFVLSGYVLSRSYFISNNTDTLVSASIRRFPRLFIPVAFTLIIAFFARRFSLIPNHDVSQITKSGWLGYIWTDDVSIRNLFKCLVYRTMFQGYNGYDTSMWTMSIELYGSIAVFAFLALTHKTKGRLLLLAIFSFILWRLSRSFYLSFMIGIGLNYLNIIVSDKTKLKGLIVFILLLIGLFLGGFPSYADGYDNETTYRFISTPLALKNAPLIHIAAASCIITALLLSNTMQRIFSGKVFGFLGDISFSSYLIHPVLIGVLACPLFLAIYNRTNNYNETVGIVFIAYIAATLVISKLMTEFVDKPGIRLSKYIYTRFFKQVND